MAVRRVQAAGGWVTAMRVVRRTLGQRGHHVTACLASPGRVRSQGGVRLVSQAVPVGS